MPNGRVTRRTVARARGQHENRGHEQRDRGKRTDVRQQRQENLPADAVALGARAHAVEVVVDGAAASRRRASISVARVR